MKLELDRISNENAHAVLDQGLAAIQSGDATFDLSAVQRCNTAAVAVLLAWQRAAQERQVALQLAGLPADLVSLAELYGVEALIATQRTAAA